MTNCGTANPDVWPLRFSMISMPFAIEVLKCSSPFAMSHW